jgi:hypothetical protein
MGSLRLEFPVMVDHVVATNPDHPCDERARLRPVRTESPIDLQENFLS